MSKRIDAETRAQIVELYLSDESMTYAKVAKHFGVAFDTARRIICSELEAGNGIKPDRRAKIAQQPDWMEHITPLVRRKRELEEKVLHKKAELDKAQQELRDYLATIRQLMTEGNT